MAEKRVTITDIIRMKEEGRKIAMITAYDYPFAKLVDEAGVDIILVGDTLGMVVLGYDTTLPVDMDTMVHHTKAVCRGARRALVVADMPFMSYQISVEQAMANAGRLMKETGAGAVKLEGGERVRESIKAMVEAGIPVMGHVGMTPQSVHGFGGFKVQGKGEAAERVKRDARAVQEAGAFSVVLEAMPRELGKEISLELTIPTIGIGGGPDCDGQVLVLHDLLGIFEEFVPKFVKRYAEMAGQVREAVSAYVDDVKKGAFPTDKESYD